MRNASLIMEEQQSIHPEAKYDHGIVTFGAFMTRAMKSIMMKVYDRIYSCHQGFPSFSPQEVALADQTATCFPLNPSHFAR